MIIGAIWLCECLRGVGKSISALAYLGQASVSFLLITSRPTELVKRKGGVGVEILLPVHLKKEQEPTTPSQVGTANCEGCMHECMDGLGRGLATTTGMYSVYDTTRTFPCLSVKRL